MRDPWNPTVADVRQRAADPASLCPTEDWDLAVTGLGFEDLFVELVEDRECPKADFFLHCLYLWAWETVRVRGGTADLERLLRGADTSSEPALRVWARRARALMADPRRASKHIWWGFGQARAADGRDGRAV